MSDPLDPLNDFIAIWRGPLDSQAEVVFEACLRDGSSGTHPAIADRFVEKLNFQPIGQNWEMLDSTGDEDAPRSAIAAFDDAMAMNMVFTRSSWLGHDEAKRCGREFLSAFNPDQRIILTNRMYFGWNPISTATFEWAFVGMDDTRIALLLLMAED
ncbi:MAG: hypothetical protein AAF250_11650 [Pseudomonadota bacterium]